MEAKLEKNVQNRDVMAILSFGTNMGGSFSVVQIMQKRSVGILRHCESNWGRRVGPNQGIEISMNSIKKEGLKEAVKKNSDAAS